MKNHFSLEELLEMFEMKPKHHIQEDYLDLIWERSLVSQLESENSGASEKQGEEIFRKKESECYKIFEANLRFATLKACSQKLSSFKIFIKIEKESFTFSSSDWKQTLRDLLNKSSLALPEEELLEAKGIAKLGTTDSAKELCLSLLMKGAAVDSAVLVNHKKYLDEAMEQI